MPSFKFHFKEIDWAFHFRLGRQMNKIKVQIRARASDFPGP